MPVRAGRTTCPTSAGQAHSACPTLASVAVRPTRRRLLAGIAAASLVRAQERRGAPPKLRTTPAVCLYSQAVIKVGYDELGPVLRGLGVDGCDLSVQPGGHVDPAHANLDLMRAVEAITGVGLDVPVITTACTALTDPTIRTIAAVCGEMGIPLMRSGIWSYSPVVEPEARLLEVQRDLAGLAALARAVNMTVAVPNVAGNHVGAGYWDMQMIMRGMDPASVGYDFDIGYATEEGAGGSWRTALRAARPRLKMVTVRDFVWSKDASGQWKAMPCPLGEGAVDWQTLFTTLAAARFVGPISVTLDYAPKEELSAIRHDVDFIRKQVKAAYGG